jgi:hypothetical protein
MIHFSKYITEARSKTFSTLLAWRNDEPVAFAKSLIKKLGQPDELTDNRAVWYDKDGFKRIEVKDEYILHCCPLPHHDFVYSTIDLPNNDNNFPLIKSINKVPFLNMKEIINNNLKPQGGTNLHSVKQTNDFIELYTKEFNSIKKQIYYNKNIE